MNSMVNISNDWFSVKERGIMTTAISGFANTAGAAVGFLLPNIWVDGDETDTDIL